MTTKATKSTTAAVEPIFDIRGDRIVIAESTSKAFAAAAILIQRGWIFCDDAPPVTYATTSQSNIQLVRGTPGGEIFAHVVAIAEAAEAHAALCHKVAYERDVAAAAQKIVDDDKAERAARQAQITHQIEQQRKALHALERAAAEVEA